MEELIQVSKEKLIEVLANNLSCCDCPCDRECRGDNYKCSQTVIENYLMPKKDYEVEIQLLSKFRARNKGEAENLVRKWIADLAEKDGSIEDWTWCVSEAESD